MVLARNSSRRKSSHGRASANVPAVRDGFLREIKSALILQPGPAALTDGLDAICGIFEEWRAQQASR